MPYNFRVADILIFHLLISLLLLTAQPANALESVTLQLKWTHAFQFAGYYVAKEKGYYKNAGLDVTIVEGRPDSDVVRQVVSGQAQYGVGTSSLLLARNAGQQVVVLAVIFQHSPLVLVAEKNSQTQSIHDLVGKRIMIEPQSDELMAYLKQEKISPDQLILEPHSFNIADLLGRNVAAMSAYATNELYYLERSGFPYQVYTPRSAGIDFYGDNLFTSEQELKSNPRRIEAFRAASLRGWQYAMQHPDEIAELIFNRYSKQHSVEFYRFEAAKMVPLLRPDLIELGYMHPGRWRHIAEVYADQGLLPRDISLNGFIYAPDGKAQMYRLYMYIGLLCVGLITIGAVALYISRINRNLKLVMADNLLATKELIQRDELWQAIIRTSPDGIVIASLDGNVRQVSDSLITMLGYESADELIGRNILEFIDQTYHEQATSRIWMMLNGTYTGSADYQVIGKDGSKKYFEANAEVLRDRDGSPSELFFINRDITERKLIEGRLCSLSVAVEQSPVSVVITNLAGVIQYVNPSFTKVTGYTAEEAIGQTPRVLKSDLTEPSVYESLWSSLVAGQIWVGQFVNKRKNGELFWEEAHIAPVFDKSGTVVQYVGVKLDITARKQVEEQITYLAQYDCLTDLPNRMRFSALLQQAMALAKRDGNCLALMFVDLDRFKPVNDTYGHAVGDLLLKHVAQLMLGAVRDSDIISRFGGDEFVVLLPQLKDPSDTLLVAEKLRLVLAAPFEIEGHVLQISASIGIAIYPDHGTEENILFQRADTAMYYAKQAGRNVVQLYGDHMQEKP